VNEPLVVDAHTTIPARELSWVAVRASGPGGQNVNKVSSKVELAFDLGGSTAIDVATKERLRMAYPSYLDAEGRLVIKSQATRDQSRNLADARERLRAMIAHALVPPKRRKKTRPTFGSKMRRLEEKARHSEKKAARRGTS
jgi:ribosome-associated protein